jgi:hypothetical protein
MASARLCRCKRHRRPTICLSVLSKRTYFTYCRDKNIVTLAYGSVCRGPLRPHDGADAVCRGRPEKDRPKVPRTSISAIPLGGRKARPVRASQLRKARHPSCLALGSRPAGLDDRALVRACPTNSPRSRSSPVAASTRPPWLKSIGFFDHSRGRRGSGIHGPACSACSLRAPKSSPPAGRRLA